MIEQKDCPVCEHWLSILANPQTGEGEKKQARYAIRNHQYLKHFKGQAEGGEEAKS